MPYEGGGIVNRDGRMDVGRLDRLARRVGTHDRLVSADHIQYLRTSSGEIVNTPGGAGPTVQAASMPSGSFFPPGFPGGTIDTSSLPAVQSDNAQVVFDAVPLLAGTNVVQLWFEVFVPGTPSLDVWLALAPFTVQPTGTPDKPGPPQMVLGTYDPQSYMRVMRRAVNDLTLDPDGPIQVPTMVPYMAVVQSQQSQSVAVIAMVGDELFDPSGVAVPPNFLAQYTVSLYAWMVTSF